MTRVRRLKKKLLCVTEQYNQTSDPTELLGLSEEIKNIKIQLDEAIVKENEKNKNTEVPIVEEKPLYKKILTWTAISVVTVIVAVGGILIYDTFYDNSDSDTE